MQERSAGGFDSSSTAACVLEMESHELRVDHGFTVTISRYCTLEMGNQPNAGFDAEFRLLLACARTPTDKALVHKLASEVKSWADFLNYAQWHDLVSITAYALLSSSAPIPHLISERLLNTSRTSAQQQMALIRELLRISESLRAQSIRAIAYKGPTLAATVYDSLGHRDFCDIDFIIAENDINRVREVLLALGYQTEYRLTPAEEKRYLRRASEWNFVHHTRQAAVEVHWRISPSPYFVLDFGRIWSRKSCFYICGARIESLSPEDNLIVLSVHGFKHLWGQLKWISDVDAVVQSSDQLDWKYILSESARLKTLRVLLCSLCLCSQLFGTVMPEHVRTEMNQDRVAASVAQQVLQRYPGHEMSPLRGQLLTFRGHTGVRARAAYMMNILLNPTLEDAVWSERSQHMLRVARVAQIACKAISWKWRVAENESPNQVKGIHR